MSSGCCGAGNCSTGWEGKEQGTAALNEVRSKGLQCWMVVVEWGWDKELRNRGQQRGKVGEEQGSNMGGEGLAAWEGFCVDVVAKLEHWSWRRIRQHGVEKGFCQRENTKSREEDQAAWGGERGAVKGKAVGLEAAGDIKWHRN